MPKLAARHAAALTAVVLFWSCAPADESAEGGSPGAEDRVRKRVRIALNWFPEAEHGGYYAALVHGYFEHRGLDVEILGGGPDAPVIQRVATGDVDFGVTNADGVLNARAAGADVVALMAPYQDSPRCIMVHAAANITNIGDIAGITLSLSQRPAFVQYLRWKFPFDDVVFVPYHGSITPFLAKAPDFAQQAYVFSEPVIARRHGADVTTLMVSETGFNPYTSLLIATTDSARRNPELMSAVVQASVQGWGHYLEHPDSTNRHILSVNPEMDAELLEEGSSSSADLVLNSVARQHGIGFMSSDRWRDLHQQMLDAGILSAGAADPQSAFTTDHLPR